MKAIVCLKYGPPDVLLLRDVEKPVPKDNEILIRIYATAVNSGDLRLRKADPFAVRFFFGLTKPKRPVLGGVLAGKIEATGKNVTRFKTGDDIFGSTGMSFGAYAEYKCLPEDGLLAIKPADMSFAEAAVIAFGGNTALYFLKKANIKTGQKVLIYGASGAVGTAAIQLARYYGAEVTGVCSTINMALVKSLGADIVIDYTKEDFTKNSVSYDVIFDTVGKISFADSIKSLQKEGILILGSSGLSKMIQGFWTGMTSERKVISGMTVETTDNVVFLKELIEKGKFKPVIDRTYPLEKIVEAHGYAELGHKKGNVAVTIAEI